MILFFATLVTCLTVSSGDELTQSCKEALSVEGEEQDGLSLLQHSVATSSLHRGGMASHAKSRLTSETIASSTMFSSIAQQSTHYRLSSGEFHNTHVRRQEATESFNSPKCKSFFNMDFLPSPVIVDGISQVFRPASEVLGPNASISGRASLPATPMQRITTFEDLAFPKYFHDAHRRDSWCEMFAVRTSQRPVKVMTARSKNGTKLMMPAIWKSASTSLNSMLLDAANKGVAFNFVGPHDAKDRCEPPNLLPQCEKHTSFDTDAAEADVRAAFVRNPLDRFLASVYEHGEWKSCSGGVCEIMVADAQNVARRLAHEFPHRWPSCEHPSQAYFLSATDVHGKPFSWDLVSRIEEFQNGLDKLHELSGVSLEELKQNASGDKKLKQMYFDAVFSDTETLCSICKVYAQDFECLGYAKPDRCTPDECAAYGISLQ